VKRLNGFALVFCLIVPFLGTWQFYSHHILRVKKSAELAIKMGINKDQQILLKFTEEESRTQLVWEHSKEFEYQGNMYDIIRIETRDDVIWYWCFLDKKETQLKRDLHLFIAGMLGQNPGNQNQENRISHFFKSLIKNSNDIYANQDFVGIHNRCLKEYFFSSLTFIPVPPVPPPDYS
jgi:hypothetical protein